MELSVKESLILLLIAFFLLGYGVATELDNIRITKKFHEVADSSKVIRIDTKYYKIISVNISSAFLIDQNWSLEVSKMYGFSQVDLHDQYNRTS